MRVVQRSAATEALIHSDVRVMPRVLSVAKEKGEGDGQKARS